MDLSYFLKTKKNAKYNLCSAKGHRNAWVLSFYWISRCSFWWNYFELANQCNVTSRQNDHKDTAYWFCSGTAIDGKLNSNCAEIRIWNNWEPPLHQNSTATASTRLSLLRVCQSVAFSPLFFICSLTLVLLSTKCPSRFIAFTTREYQFNNGGGGVSVRLRWAPDEGTWDYNVWIPLKLPHMGIS